MAFCSNCGAVVKDGSSYCEICGQVVVPDTQVFCLLYHRGQQLRKKVLRFTMPWHPSMLLMKR